MSEYLNMNTDELLRLIAVKDMQALETLIQRFLPAIEAIASKFSGAAPDRDDLIQEGMLGCLNGIYSYKAEKSASLKTYLNVCIERSIINAVRKCSRKKDFPPDAIVPLDDDYLSGIYSSDTPEDFLIAKEQADKITSLIEENLSDTEINVLQLHIVGYSYAQISQRLNKSTKAVDNALQRARNKLQKLVQ